MTVKRLFLTLFLLPAVLLLVAYLAWPLWTTPLAKRLLSSSEVELLAVQIARPGWQQLDIHDLKLRYSADQYHALLKVPELTLSYDWQGLLVGSFNALQIPAAQVTFQSQQTKPATRLTPAAKVLSVTRFLPAVLFAQLPVTQIQLQQLTLSLPEQLGFDDLSGSLEVSDGQLQLQLASLKPSQQQLTALVLKLLISSDNRLQLLLQHNSQPVITANSRILEGQVRGELTVNLATSAVLLKQLQLIAAQTQMQGQLALQWQLPLPEELMVDKWAVTADIQSQLTLKEFKQDEISIGAVNYSGAGQTLLSANTTRLQFEAGSELQVRQLKAPDLAINNIQSTLPQPVELVLQSQQLSVPKLVVVLPATLLYWQQQGYRFKSSHIKLTDLVVNLQQLRQARQHSGTLALTLTEARRHGAVKQAEVHIKPLDLQGRWQLNNGHLKGDFQLTDTAKIVLITGAMSHDLMSQSGQLSLQLQPLRFQKSHSYLPRLVSNWHYPIDLFAGELAITSRISWKQTQFDGQAMIKLKDIGGFYDTNLWHGLNAEIAIAGLLHNPVVTTEKLTVSRVDVGVPISNIQLALEATAKELQIKNFQAELLGGRVGQRLILYDFSQQQNELLLHLRGLDLGQLVGLETGIEGSGVLDGKLPIRIGATGVSVQQGEIKARSPGGVIKYSGVKSMSAAADDIGVGFALQALENFHYQVLDVKATYTEDGQLILAALLQGRNPAMKEQRPVHYNITVEENIPVLIASLKLTQHISGDIERRIQAFYKKDKQVKTQ